MNAPVRLAETGPSTRVIKLAVLALGGQGGGVLTSWIEATARRCGYHVQATSVAGVAQRTGATIYYIEMADAAAAPGRTPVFALAPAAGDVDILVAAELMEAGRAIQRGFVTPDRTTLVASTHRAFATVEKIAPGDGRADGTEVIAAANVASKDAVLLELETVAREAGSVISASLFGALAASGALPFSRADYEATIRESGRGVDASLAAFAEAWRRVEEGEEPAPEPAGEETKDVTGPDRLLAEWRALETRTNQLPEPARAMALAGLKKVVDFQDTRYGAEFLDRVEQAAAIDDGHNDHHLTTMAAKYVANAMAYDDVIRVADLKTRAARFRRIRAEMGVKDGQVMALTEYMHPRAEEMVGLLPAGIGAWVEARPRLMGWIDRRVNRGRRVKSAGAFWFKALWLMAGLRPIRRRLRRHAVETEHLDRWFALALETARTDMALGAEVLATRRLIKGYSDTHARGLSKFDRVLSALPTLAGRHDAADWLRRLREAALRDEKGKALDGALKTIETLPTAEAA